MCYCNCANGFRKVKRNAAFPKARINFKLESGLFAMESISYAKVLWAEIADVAFMLRLPTANPV